eukprot:Opistho-2@64597
MHYRTRLVGTKTTASARMSQNHSRRKLRRTMMRRRRKGPYDESGRPGTPVARARRRAEAGGAIDPLLRRPITGLSNDGEGWWGDRLRGVFGGGLGASMDSSRSSSPLDPPEWPQYGEYVSKHTSAAGSAWKSEGSASDANGFAAHSAQPVTCPA